MHATEHRQSRPNPHSRRFTFQLRVVAVAAPKPPAMAETADKVAMYGSAADGKGNTACREGGWTEEQGKLAKLQSGARPGQPRSRGGFVDWIRPWGIRRGAVLATRSGVLVV